jgi:hypothetical protein
MAREEEDTCSEGGGMTVIESNILVLLRGDDGGNSVTELVSEIYDADGDACPLWFCSLFSCGEKAGETDGVMLRPLTGEKSVCCVSATM